MNVDDLGVRAFGVAGFGGLGFGGGGFGFRFEDVGLRTWECEVGDFGFSS